MVFIKNKLTIFSGIGCLLIGRYWNKQIERFFPPEKIPDLPPLPGYQVFGYMGCPASKVEEIRKKKRLLFFADSVAIPQQYALQRTSWWARMRGVDQPVVVQLEIRKGTTIHQEDLWHDPQLKACSVTPPLVVSYWPAIPPEIQNQCDLQVRIHHVVNQNVLQTKGANSRALKAFFKTMVS